MRGVPRAVQSHALLHGLGGWPFSPAALEAGADYSLAPGVHAVAIGQNLVLLDIAADAYFCLAGAGAVVVLGPDGSIRVDDPRPGIRSSRPASS